MKKLIPILLLGSISMFISTSYAENMTSETKLETAKDGMSKDGMSKDEMSKDGM